LQQHCCRAAYGAAVVAVTCGRCWRVPHAAKAVCALGLAVLGTLDFDAPADRFPPGRHFKPYVPTMKHSIAENTVMHLAAIMRMVPSLRQ